MSKLIAWSDSLASGVPEIDGHHKGLVTLLNDLHENVHRRRGVNACRESVDRLRSYAQAHFAVEENLMHLAGCTAYQEDPAEQRQLLALLDEMLARMDESNSNITFHGLHQLKVWVLRHIRTTSADAAATAVPADGDNSSSRGFRLSLKRA